MIASRIAACAAVTACVLLTAGQAKAKADDCRFEVAGKPVLSRGKDIVADRDARGARRGLGGGPGRAGHR